MLQMTYFANVKKLGDMNFVSIAGKTPKGFPGLIYSPLAPKYDWWIDWKTNNLSTEWYINKYVDTVLAYLKPKDVIKIIGEDAVICCYETPEKFCHRHIVAKWFERAGYKIKEINT